MPTATATRAHSLSANPLGGQQQDTVGTFPCISNNSNIPVNSVKFPISVLDNNTPMDPSHPLHIVSVSSQQLSVANTKND